MRSTMQDGVLSITSILEYGANLFSNSMVTTYLGESDTKFSFEETAKRVGSLANALSSIGVSSFDRVATFLFNNQQHLETYFAVPSMGAVLHTLNLRLFQDQLSFIINDAEDKVIITESVVLPLLTRVLSETPSVKAILVVGPHDPAMFDPFDVEVYDYEQLIAAHSSTYVWPAIDEYQAAAMCYTSGTTGNPKGVVYSHRSTWLHSISSCTANTLGLSNYDTALLIVPMFHANGWGIPYSGWMGGCDLIMPSRFLQGEHIANMIAKYRPTVSSGVPTIWNELILYGETHEIDLSSLRGITGGGSSVPEGLVRKFRDRYGVELLQGWGMTETSPVCTLSIPPRNAKEGDLRVKYLVTAGRPSMGVEIRIVDDTGKALARGTENLGEIEVRGPWIANSYFKSRGSESFDNGWLKTGDMGTLDEEGYLRIVDRTKDVIKSGGEWISSVDLENALMAYPDVFEAAVIGIPDEKWVERPLACVVPKPGTTIDSDNLVAFLTQKVAKWWLPEQISIVQEIPKTSVGKFDKKVLRKAFSDGQLATIPVNKQ